MRSLYAVFSTYMDNLSTGVHMNSEFWWSLYKLMFNNVGLPVLDVNYRNYGITKYVQSYLISLQVHVCAGYLPGLWS